MKTVHFDVSTIFNVEFSPGTAYDVGQLPLSVVSGDFDGDGNQDLATANFTSKDISVLLGNGNGTFNTATNYGVGTGTGTYDITTGDLNNDGKLDLAVANRDSDEVSILLGNGDGTFGVATNYNVSSPFSVAIKDFNNDGIQDLAVGRGSSGDISILLGNGNGTFGTATSINTGESAPLQVTVGDFNNDGNSDIATANYWGTNNQGNISILLGNGSGTFSSPTTYIAGSQGSDFSSSPRPRDIQVGDFNQDGKQDLAVANEGTREISILLGQGNGSFEAATNYTNISGNHLTIDDFNHDGIQDIATSALNILLGNGDGTFDAPVSFPTSQSNSIANGDFDNDGHSDLVSTRSSNDVFVLLSKSNDVPNAEDDTATTDEDTATTGNVLDNDTDAEGDTLSVTQINGQSAWVGNRIMLNSGASLTLNADGTYNYDPNGSFEDLNSGETATDSFTYTVSNGTESDTAEVIITIDGVDDGPVAVDDVATTDEDTATTGNVLDNDTDAEGDTLSVTQINGQSAWVGNRIMLNSGALLNLNADGTYTYYSNGKFEFLNSGETATDSFTYTVSNGTESDTAEVIITIDGVDDGPTPTTGNDRLTYDDDDDLIYALGGNDLIRAGGGDDDVFGNDGNDKLFGQDGHDFLDGGAGNDQLWGENGDDLLHGQEGNDKLWGDYGDDLLTGGSGNDWLSGGLDNDTLIGVNQDSFTPGNDERDLLRGGSGADIYVLGNEYGSFYINKGKKDRAMIEGFDLEVDQIQLHGNLDDYLLRETRRGNTNIFDISGGGRELIGIVRNATGLDSTNNPSFVFEEFTGL